MSKENKILLVLGGSSDMGMSLIRKVASQYDTVLAQYRTLSEDLSLLQKELGDRLICLPADFSDKDSTKKFIANIVEQRLFPDHIVHFSAPKFKNIKFAKSSWDDFENGFQISLHSLYETLCAFLPYMKKQHYGRVIVALSSCCENMPPKYLSPYVTVKYSLLGLVKALAVEYADFDITVNGISPEMTDTKFLSEIPELIVQKSGMDNPLGRNLSVEEVVPTFEFLLSDGADCITGQNIAITGGK